MNGQQRMALIWVLVLVTGAEIFAGERPEICDLIDDQIVSKLAADSLPLSSRIDDYAFARRVTLDLAGRIPTLEELTRFVESPAENKRSTYVDQLLASEDFALHLRDSLDLLLLAPLKQDDGWRAYLLEATLENRPWDSIFEEILLPERLHPNDKRPASFLQARAQELDTITNDVSSLLFGINIACAKCHDHPLVGDWEQRHYFGLASFFDRTYSTRAGLVSEKFVGRVQFTDVSGEQHMADFMFLNGASVSEPENLLAEDELKKISQMIKEAERTEDAPSPPMPEFSPRMELVRLARSSSESNLLARNMVNRTWARLIGQGLVYPLDQMHSENPASHPQVLDQLASDFAGHGYDLRRLIRIIVLTDTYARSSRWPMDEELPAAERFARGLVRPLSPHQLALSLHVASSHPRKLGGLHDPLEWKSRRAELEQRSRKLAQSLPIPTDGFQVSTEEAMQFSNSPEFHQALLGGGQDRLVGHLGDLDNDHELARTAFLTIVSRPPSEAEVDAMERYLMQRPDRRLEAIQQIVWSLLASPETRFNH